jgi:chemotaxis regulatin CheY-phosphate phosphatase CheZ
MRNHRNPQARLPKPPTPDNHAPRTSAEFDGHVNELRKALGRVDALTDALQRSFDQRHVDEVDSDVVERRTSYLIDMTAEAALRAFDELNRAGDALGSEDADERS